MPAFRRNPFIALAVLLGLSLPCSLRADVVEINGIQWTYSVANGEATVEGIPTSTSGSVTIPQTLSGCPVTSIGQYAFSGCSLMTSITIPSSVTTTGYSAFYNCSRLTEVHIDDLVSWCSVSFDSYYGNPTTYAQHLFLNGEEIKSLVIPNEVTSIGSSAFFYCSGLTSVTIPDSVTSIGNHAFLGCSGLTSIVIPNSVTNIEEAAFGLCSGLQSIVFGHGIKVIGEGAFSGCTGLISIAIPNGVTRIGRQAFQGCSSLTSITIPDSLTSMGEAAFNECYAVQDTSTYPGLILVEGWIVGWLVSSPSGHLDLTELRGIADKCFLNCSLLSSVTFPSRMTEIGNEVFSGCSGLTSVVIPDGVTRIGDSAFLNCSSLTSVMIPDSVTSIGNLAFYNCSRLTSITIPDSVTSIGSYVFGSCSGLTSVTIPDSVTSIESHAFASCSGLTSVTIPDSVTSIASDAFRLCSTIKVVIFPGRFALSSLFPNSYTQITNAVLALGVTDLADYAFSGCSGLTSVTIPDSVTNIGNSAFYNCPGLASITIPDGVEIIGNSAFYYCSGLTSVTIPDSVTSIGNQAFYNCSNLRNVRLSDIAAWCAVSFGDSYASPFRYAANLYLDGGLVSDLVIPAGVTAIPPYAFYNCDCLQSVSIPDSVETIGDYAFGDCDNIVGVRVPQCVMTKGLSSVFRRSYTKITSLHLGADVSAIGANEFNGFNALTSISVEAGNDDFVVSSDGCLYDAERKTLYVCPRNATRVELPDGLENLSVNSFQNCAGLTSVVFPESVSLIPPAAFNGCDALWTEWYRSLANFSAGGGSGGGETTRISFTATNVVLHYVASAVPSGAVTPPTAEGLVNVVTEIAASRAIAVSSDWAAQYPGFENRYGTDFGAAIVAENGKTDGAGHPMFVWQDYVAGTDPTDPDDRFVASISFDAATGDPVVSWSPELSAAEAAKRVYRIYGKVRLNDADWTLVAGNAADYNFFKVRVEMK